MPLVKNLDKKYTYQDYLNFPDDKRCEIIDGKLYDMTPAPKVKHQRISRKVSEILFANREKLKRCEYFIAPTDVVFDNENVYQPYIVFISKDRLHIKEDGVYGAPDLIIEILSPATAYYDLRIKFKVYERYGVKEYWIVDPELKEIEIYQLQNNKFVFVEKAEKEAKIKSTLLSGLEVGLKDVFV